MDFSTAQYDSLIQKIGTGIQTAHSDAQAAVHGIESAFGWIPFIGDMLKAVLDKFLSLLDELLKKIGSTLKWSAVPPAMWEYGQHWLSMAGQAAQSATSLAGLKQYSSEWEGIAGGKYNSAVTGQGPAVDTIQTRSNEISGACTGTAMAGFAFYISVAGLLTGLIAAIMTAGTGVGLVAGVSIVLLSLTGAVTSLLLGVGLQARSFTQANEPTDTMPGNAWPHATS